MVEGPASERLKSRPRVLLLIDGLGRGGAERQARLLLTHIPAERVTIRLACFGGDADELERVAEAGVPIDLLPATPRRLWPVRVLWILRGLVRRHRIGIVQAFLPTFDILAPCLRLLVPGIRVVTSRRNVVEQLSPGRLRMVRMTNRLADGVVANSEAVAESVRRIERVSGPRLRVIPNGVELPPAVGERERIEARRRFGLPDDAFVVAYIAHFRDGKGHERVPSLARDLIARVPRAQILMAGDTESNRAYRRNAGAFRGAIASLGVDRQVRCIGRIPESRPLLAASDVCLNLSDVEGMSNALLESMAVGVPVVASDAGGAREMIEDGREGWIVGRADTNRAVALLVRLAGDAGLRGCAGAAARDRIERDFSVARMAGAYADLYEELA